MCGESSLINGLFVNIVSLFSMFSAVLIVFYEFSSRPDFLVIDLCLSEEVIGALLILSLTSVGILDRVDVLMNPESPVALYRFMSEVIYEAVNSD